MTSLISIVLEVNWMLHQKTKNKNKQTTNKKTGLRPGETADGLKAHATFPAPIQWFITIRNFIFRISDTLFGPPRAPGQSWFTYKQAG